MSYYSEQELRALGLKQVGRNVRLSRKASVYNAKEIEIGDDSRIDDYCVLSAGAGGICIGRNVHVAVYTSLIGAARIELHDFSNLSSRVSIYSSNDDYSGSWMTNPTVPAEFTNVTHLPVVVGRHVIVGAGTVILPGVTVHEGSGIGALSLVNQSCEAFGFYAGTPIRKIGPRKSGLLDLEAKFLAARDSSMKDS